MTRAIPGVALLLVAACSVPGTPAPVAAPPATVAPSSPAAWREIAAPGAGSGLRFSDGRARIVALESTVTVQRDVAWAETKITLENPTDARLAGVLELATPEDTFATDVDGAPAHEAELGGPGTRVFRSGRLELAAKGRREMVFKHAVRLTREASPVLRFGALAGVRPSVTVSGATPLRSEGGDLDLTGSPRKRGARPAASHSSITVAIDTSAARAFDLQSQLQLVRTLAARHPQARLRVAAYDLGLVELYDGPARALDGKIADRLAARGAFGASDVGPALRWALSQPSDLTLVVADGRDVEPVSALADKPPSPRGRFRFVIPASGARDEAALAWLTGRLAHDVEAPVQLSDGLDAVLAGDPVLDPLALTDAPGWLTRAPAPKAVHSRAMRDALLSGMRPMPPASLERDELDPLEDLKAPTKAPVEEIPTVEPVAKVAAGGAAAGSGGGKPATDAPPIAAAPEARRQIPPDTIRDIVRKNFGRFRGCFVEALHRSPKAGGRLMIRFDIETSGVVSMARAVDSSVADVKLTACVVRGFEALSFPESPSGALTVNYPIVFQKGDPADDLAAKRRGMPAIPASDSPMFQAPKEGLAGEPLRIVQASQRGDATTAVSLALAALDRDRRDALGYELYGDALAAAGDKAGAARVYASIPELGQRGGLRRAAARLAGLGEVGAPAALALASRAVDDDPDDLAAYRLVAALLAREGQLDGALGALDVALGRRSQALRTPATREVLRGDLGLVAATYIAKQPAMKIRLGRWLADVGATVDSGPAVRFSASWAGEGDIDLVVADRGLTEATKTRPFLPTGGKLLGDAKGASATEVFVLDSATASRVYPYQLKVALGASDEPYASGTVEVLESDGAGGLLFTTHPWVLNVLGGRVDVVSVDGPLPASRPLTK